MNEMHLHDSERPIPADEAGDKMLVRYLENAAWWQGRHCGRGGGDHETDAVRNYRGLVLDTLRSLREQIAEMQRALEECRE